MYDIHHMLMTMSWYWDMAREDHLEKVKRMFEYLQNFSDTSIVFDVDKFNHSRYDHMKIQHEWKYIYGDVKEEIPKDRPDPREKSAQTTSFCNANLVHDLVTGRLVSGILHFVNKTPIESFSEQQNQVETAVYGSEFMAGRIAVEQIMELRHTLMMLGIPIDGPAYLFGDNLSMITSSTIPSSSLKKRHSMLSYHCVREAIASGIRNLFHIPESENPSDVMTKH